MNPRLPSFFVVGAQKAGTTTLDEWLGAEPGVCTPSRKETHFFSHDERFSRGIEWYAAQFEGGADCRILGEVDPDYLFFPEAAKRIHRSIPGARLVFVFRHPLERARSHHRMSVQRGLEPRSFPEALEREEARLGRGGWESRMHHSYLARSRYCVQVRRYLELFPRASMHFVKFDDLFDARTGSSTYRELCEFLGFRSSLDPARHSARRNPASGTRSRWINRLLWKRSEMGRLRRLVRWSLPSPRLRYRLARGLYDLNRKPRARTAGGAELPVSRHLVAGLRAEVTELSELTGLALDDWDASLRGLERHGPD